jgi:hypothetical protein
VLVSVINLWGLDTWLVTLDCNSFPPFPSLDKNYDFGLPHTSSIEVVGPGPAKGTLITDLLGKAAVTVEGATTDKMEESLTCIICQDLLHDCVRYSKTLPTTTKFENRPTPHFHCLWLLAADENNCFNKYNI